MKTEICKRKKNFLRGPVNLWYILVGHIVHSRNAWHWVGRRVGINEALLGPYKLCITWGNILGKSCDEKMNFLIFCQNLLVVICAITAKPVTQTTSK